MSHFEFGLQVIIPMDAPRILMLEVAEQVAAVTLLSHLPGIQAVSGHQALSRRLASCQTLARLNLNPTLATPL